eukprot:c2252_g1_i1.p1 GENE.c2252_g1_i1~~c2252_g1_i1.p1  ORF type:complete len:592 (+),score=117.75 c2252_g1_i1:267-2042(+)
MWAKTSLVDDVLGEAPKSASKFVLVKTGWVLLKETKRGLWGIRWIVITPHTVFAFKCPGHTLKNATHVSVLPQPFVLKTRNINTDPTPRPTPPPAQRNQLYPSLSFNSTSSKEPPLPDQILPGRKTKVGICGGRSRALTLLCSNKRIWFRLLDKDDTEQNWREWLEAFETSTTARLQFQTSPITIETELIQYLVLGQFRNADTLRSSATSQIVLAGPLHESKLANLVPRRCLLDTRAIMWGCTRSDFDIFRVNDATMTRPARVVAYFCIHSLGLGHANLIPDPVFQAFTAEVENGYKKTNLFHSNIHAADVTQTMFLIIRDCGLQKYLEPLEMLCCLLAAMAHDLQHPGFTNSFLSASGHPLASLYSAPILENFHIHSTFQVLAKSRCNVFGHLPKEQRLKARKWIRELILATDMSRHFDARWEFNAMVDSPEGLDLSDSAVRLRVMQQALHCADISNPTKPWAVYSQWIRRIMGEFYIQGDLEKNLGLKVSPFMDRALASESYEARCQVSFMDTFVHPLFLTLSRFVRRYCPESLGAVDLMLTNLTANRRLLKSVIQRDPNGRPSLASNASSIRSNSNQTGNIQKNLVDT